MKPKMLTALCKKSLTALRKARLKTGLYVKASLPEYDFDHLQRIWPYVKPNCVSEDFHRLTGEGVDLSICIPMYNVEAFIEPLLDVLDRQQTEYTFEVILVDDGSKDKTAEIVKRFIAGKPNFVLIQQKNGGISVARNTAIDHAHGEYISFVDSDDLVSNDFIQSLMSAAKENQADIVKGKYCIRRGESIVPMGLSTGFFWGGVYRASLFDKVRFPVGYWYEDMIQLFLIVPQAKTTIPIDNVTLYYNDTEGSASKLQARARNPKSLEQLYLVMSLTEDYKKLQLTNRAWLSERLVAECSKLMVRRTEGLDELTRKQVFLACHKLFCDEQVDPTQFSGVPRLFAEAIVKKDYAAWKLAAKLS